MSGAQLPPENVEEPNTRQKKGKKRNAKESVLSDLSFIEAKNKKLKLEIEALQMTTEVKREKEALELDLLRSKIAEVNTRREFFASLIGKTNSLSVLSSLFEQNED